MLLDSIAFEVNGVNAVFDGCYADTATVGFWVKGANTIITNGGSYNNRLMGLRNTMAIKNESEKLIVTNCRFTPTKTDLLYEGKRDAVVLQCNNVADEEILSKYSILK